MLLFRVKLKNGSATGGLTELPTNTKGCKPTTKEGRGDKQNLVASFGPHVSKHHKSWTEYSAQYQRQQKRQIASDMSTALEFTKDTFFQPLRVEMVSKETNELITVNDNGSL